MSELGGLVLLQQNENSLFKVLSRVFPEYNWIQWKFESEHEYWNKVENQREFMENAATELKIKEFNDWYKITNHVNKHERL